MNFLGIILLRRKYPKKWEGGFSPLVSFVTNQNYLNNDKKK